MTTTLTKQESEIVKYLSKQIGKGRNPSGSELGRHFGFSTQHSCKVLRTLEGKGAITRDKDSLQRSIPGSLKIISSEN